MKKQAWFGIAIMAAVLAVVFVLMPPPAQMTNGHLGLLMLALIVVAIMLGFPTAFTLMGMGVFFAWLAYRSQNPVLAMQQTLDLMVQRAYAVMSNDVLISIPLFVFMGYLVERANLIDRLFKSLHLALARVPGSLAVATIVTCAIFATATGIVGAVVTLMGLLAMPAMLRAGYDARLAAGTITAGGCLGILIPPSVLLIVYGATAGVSVVQLYAGAFFPGIMLAALYVGYVLILTWLRPALAPALSAAGRRVDLPPFAQALSSRYSTKVVPGLVGAISAGRGGAVAPRTLLNHLLLVSLPVLAFAAMMGMAYLALTAPADSGAAEGLVEMGAQTSTEGADAATSSGGLSEPPAADALPQAASGDAQAPPAAAVQPAAGTGGTSVSERVDAPAGYWIAVGVGVALLAVFYAMLTFARLEIFKMLLSSFFPLTVLILAVLGSIVFGLATPTEAAAMGALGGYVLAAVYALLRQPAQRVRAVARMWAPLWGLFGIVVAWLLLHRFEVVATALPYWLGTLAVIGIAVWCVIAYRQSGLGPMVRESVLLTGKTSAMVCWLFVGSSIFSAAFALLGGQEIVNQWVLSLELTPVQFLLLSQVVIFLLGWPLEWTEIIVIFMPIFIPLLPHFNIDPLFFGLLVALNLQTAFLSPPVAMAAFYLKGVSPPHVSLNQIFAGMLPFMVIQVLAIFLLYLFPGIGMWLPQTLYK